MAHVLKDLMTGGAVIIAGVFLSLIAIIVLSILGLLFHIIGFVAMGLFFLFLFFFAVWLVGFLYRKIKEINRK